MALAFAAALTLTSSRLRILQARASRIDRITRLPVPSGLFPRWLLVQRVRPVRGLAMASSRHLRRAMPERTCLPLAGQHRSSRGRGVCTTSRSHSLWPPLHFITQLSRSR